MPFRPKKKQPSFAPLKGSLAQARDTDNALYQTIQILIERLMQYQGVINDELADINASINAVIKPTRLLNKSFVNR